MKESENAVQQAARRLRLALPLMSRHQSPVTPLNYAVWYEYVSGSNRALGEALDALLASDAPLDDEALARLHAEFIMPADEAWVRETRDGVARLIDEVAGIVGEAGGGARRYQASLEAYRERLSPDVGLDEVIRVIEGLSLETKVATEASSEMRQRLDDSRQEVQALRAELERAREEATIDVLTGLANRKGLADAFDAASALADRAEFAHCMLIGDIDHFKRVNDAHGHIVGDKVIKHVAGVIRNTVKGKDTASRYGGEEFAVLLPDTPFSGAMKLAENVRVEVERSRLVKTYSREPIGTVTLSIGVARHRGGESLEALIARADAALYRAKGGGRNRVEPEDEATSGADLAAVSVH